LNELIHRIPFLRILAAFLGGIFFSYYFSPRIGIFWLVALAILLIVSFVLTIGNKVTFVIAFLLFCFLFSAGILRFQTYNSKPDLLSGNYYTVTIMEYPIKKQKSFKTEARLINVATKDSIFSTKEKIVIYFQPDSLVEQLRPGDQVLFKTQLQEITNPGNPYEFDFKGYMGNRKIFRQVYLASSKWKISGRIVHPNLKIISEKTRHRLLDIYRMNHIDGEKFAILAALTLGYQDALDPETRQVFSSTGTTHVLSVSGLHVGIVFIAINFLFGFLRGTKRGKFVFLIISVILLWGFAFITGLSAAVLRATVMFCFLVIGENIQRPVDIYNTLALSAFILLFINPNLVFDIGFQLSYIAVWGIVFFQPRIESWLTFKNRFARWAWSLFCVSLAAQLVTFPLTIYYFNQFPNYFWAANFVIIPASTLFIFLGIAIILFSYFPMISSILSQITSVLLDWVYFVLGKFQDLPLAVIRNIHISPVQLILLCSSVIVLALFVLVKKSKFLFTAISFILIFYIANIVENYYYTGKDEIIVYNSSGGKLIHLISGFRNYAIFEDSSQLSSYDKNLLENVRTSYHLAKTNFIQKDGSFEDDLLFLKKGVVSFKGKILFIDTNGKSGFPKIEPDFILTDGQFKEGTSGKTQIINTNNFYRKEKETGGKFNIKKEGAFVYSF
jgi:competence protein ComEC